MPEKWTLKAAKARVRELGFTLYNTGDDYRLCPVNEPEKSAYYSDDLDDIVRSAINWR